MPAQPARRGGRGRSELRSDPLPTHFFILLSLRKTVRDSSPDHMIYGDEFVGLESVIQDKNETCCGMNTLPQKFRGDAPQFILGNRPASCITKCYVTNVYFPGSTSGCDLCPHEGRCSRIRIRSRLDRRKPRCTRTRCARVRGTKGFAERQSARRTRHRIDYR